MAYRYTRHDSYKIIYQILAIVHRLCIDRLNLQFSLSCVSSNSASATTTAKKIVTHLGEEGCKYAQLHHHRGIRHRQPLRHVGRPQSCRGATQQPLQSAASTTPSVSPYTLNSRTPATTTSSPTLSPTGTTPILRLRRLPSSSNSAAKHGHRQLVLLLLKHGVDPSCRQGPTVPLAAARVGGYLQIEHDLKDAGATASIDGGFVTVTQLFNLLNFHESK